MASGSRQHRNRVVAALAAIVLAIGLIPLPVTAFAEDPATANEPTTHKVDVIGGTADKKTAKPGEEVTITANAPKAGYVFVQWESKYSDVSLNPLDKTSAKFSMPDHDVEFTAVCRELVIDDIPSHEYTGDSITPEPEAYLDGVDLITWDSKTYRYVNNEDVGTATVFVEFSDRLGSNSTTFDITEADISKADIKVADLVYGNKPNPTVTWESTTLTKTLEEGTDYTVTCSNASVGKATVTIKGIGNFTGSKESEEFNITERPVTITVDDASKVVGEADPTFTGAVSGLVKDGDLGEIKYVRTNGDETVGTYKDVLTATYTPNANYTVSVVNGSFTIKALYTVIWLDGDGSVLQTKTYAEGDEPPVYDGKTPTKAATAKHYYVFTGWDGGTVEGTTTTYKPLFDEKEKGVYEVVSGAGGTWTEGSSEPLVFVFKRTVDDETTFDHFTGILMDGKAVPEKDSSGRVNWTAEKGSVIVSLQPAYVATLSEGDHTLTAQFDDGNNVDVPFKVAAKSPNDKPSNTPKTGDGNGTLVIGLSAAALISLCVMAAYAARRRRDN